MTTPTICRSLVYILLAMAAPLASAASITADFNESNALTDWMLSGPASLDVAIVRGETGSALKVAPGARALLPIAEANRAGTVTMWFYDDGSTRPDERTRGSGPLYGIVTDSGKALVLGAIYAPYLRGNSSYALAEFDLDGGKPLDGVTYLGLKRTAGWHKLSFVFDADKGLEILLDDRSVNQPRMRFMWARSGVEGFAGAVVLCDSGKPGDPGVQQARIDDLHVETTGPMRVTPMGSLVPPTDPPAEDPAIDIAESLRGRHPRLLFDAGDLDALRTFADSPAAAPYREAFEGYLPSCVAPDKAKFLSDATDAQRQGLWRMPTIALHYVLTGERDSFDRTVAYMRLLLELPHWETAELDNGMSAANIMIGAALAYDWLYNELDPTFREQFRRKLWTHARRMYYLGHLRRDTSGHFYWEGDPQNNHRWHRDAGLVLCALAAWEGREDQAWLLGKVREEMNFVDRWLPADGTSHESFTYTIFGGTHLMLAAQAADRCLGTKLMKSDFVRHLPDFMNASVAPDLEHRFAFGDQGAFTIGKQAYDLFLLACCGANGLANHLALMDALVERHGVMMNGAWEGLLWHPRSLSGGDYRKLPEFNFFSDLGLMTVRSGWEADDAAALFKCGPFGGYLLNRYRKTHPEGFINVAHDDPDANSFLLFVQGQFLAHTDGYSKHKKSANHNTILVNGTGQTVAGRPEGPVFWQPGREDMSEVAVVTTLARAGANAAIEGEAAGSYPALRGAKGRPALERFRRSFFWIEGRYVLVLDDIRAPEEVEITWLMQGPQLTGRDAEALVFRLAAGAADGKADSDAGCNFQVAATAAVSATIAESSADTRGTPLGWQQLQLKAKTKSLRVASVYDLWGRGGLTVSLEAAGEGEDAAVVRVNGPGIADRWQWTAPTGGLAPSTIVGTDAEGNTIIELNQREPETRELLEANRAAGQ